MFSGITHLWGDLLLANNDKNKVINDPCEGVDADGDTNAQSPDCLSVLTVEVVMMGVSVDNSRVDNGYDNGDNVTTAADVTSAHHGLHKHCLENPWTEGLIKLKKDDFVGVAAKKNARKDRKCSVAKFIVKVVKDAKENNGGTIGQEAVVTSPSSWLETVHNFNTLYYLA